MSIFVAQVGGVLLAHETYALVKDTVLAEEQAAVSAKGFADPVRTYKVVGIYDDPLCLQLGPGRP